jgi:hypothetical protein
MRASVSLVLSSVGKVGRRITDVNDATSADDWDSEFAAAGQEFIALGARIEP